MLREAQNPCDELYNLRMKYGLSILEAAEILGVSSTTMYRYETLGAIVDDTIIETAVRAISENMKDKLTNLSSIQPARKCDERSKD